MKGIIFYIYLTLVTKLPHPFTIHLDLFSSTSMFLEQWTDEILTLVMHDVISTTDQSCGLQSIQQHYFFI